MGGRWGAARWVAQRARYRHPARIQDGRPARQTALDADHGARLDVRAAGRRLAELPDADAGKLACRAPAWLRAEPHWLRDGS
jgi:hypothetical protein